MNYLKFVLTIIAACQVYFVARDAISPASAMGTQDVNIVGVAGLYPGGGLPVRVMP